MMREINIIKFVPVDNSCFWYQQKKVKSMRLINWLFQVCGVYIANVYIYICIIYVLIIVYII